MEQHCEELQEAVDTIRVSVDVPTLQSLQRNQQSQPAKTKRGRSGQAGFPSEHASTNKGAAVRHAGYTSSEDSSHTDEESGIHGSDESDFAGFEVSFRCIETFCLVN